MTDGGSALRSYTAMTIGALAAHLSDDADADGRWLLLLEFLEEYSHEPASRRRSLVEGEPSTTGDDRWDALLAGIAEWLAACGGFPAPSWVDRPERTLDTAWCPYALASLRQFANDNSPPEIRRHGVLIDPYDLARA